MKTLFSLNLTCLTPSGRYVSLDEENMDWSPQTNCHLAYSEALDTTDLTKSSLSVMSLGDKDQ